MSSTRDFKSPGIFAEDATTVIPPTPIAGVAYRNAASGANDTPNGWRYGTRVESQDWNQIMFLLTSMLSTLDKQGILGWSNLVDYTVPALSFGSNGLLYIATQPSGPSTSVQDPTTAPTHWEQFASNGFVVFSTPGVFTWTVPKSLQLGYGRPKVTVIGGGGGNQGGSGGTSSFGGFCQATGGQPSSGTVAGVGGVATGGDINIPGGNGGSSNPGSRSSGGGSFFGVSGEGRSNTGIYGCGDSGDIGQAGAAAGGTAIKQVDLTGVTSVSVTVGAPGVSGGQPAPGGGIVIIEW